MKKYREYKVSANDPDYVYYLRIKPENGKHLCRLEEWASTPCGDKYGGEWSGHGEFLQHRDFDITTAMGDFLSLGEFYEKRNSEYMQVSEALNEEYKKGIKNQKFIDEYSELWKELNKFWTEYKHHPFFMGHDFTMQQLHTVPKPEIMHIIRSELIKNHWITDMYKILKTRKFHLDDFDIIREMFRVQIRHEATYKTPNRCTRHEQGSEQFSIGYEKPFHTDTFPDVELLLSSAKLHHYECYSVDEIFFSLWHYCASNKLKFAFCEHCGRLFVAQSLKKKYCNRKSPYNGYEHLECEQAVRNILQKLSRKRKAIYSNLQPYEEHSGKLNDFLSECAMYTDRIKNENATTENLRHYEDFLYNPEIKERWSKKCHVKPISPPTVQAISV